MTFYIDMKARYTPNISDREFSDKMNDLEGAIMIDMITSDRGLRLIESFEGFSPIPYEDVAGKLSIGFGHLIRPNETFTSITEEQASQLLAQDVKFAESAICQSVCVDINQNQFDALVSFTYNVGGGNLLKSTLLEMLNDSDFEGAADQFLVWDHASGQVVEGLENRRKVERALFLTI